MVRDKEELTAQKDLMFNHRNPLKSRQTSSECETPDKCEASILKLCFGSKKTNQ
jgi:hypothetical protein